MKEIVIIRSYLYRKGSGVFLDRLIEDQQEATNKWGKCKILWWFDCPDQTGMTIEKAAYLDEKGQFLGSATLLMDAIRFKFEPLPNIHANHFDQSVLFSEWSHAGIDVFEPFLEQFVAIVKPQVDEWLGDFDFYGLFEVETDEHRDSDGGLDSINIWAEFLGELDMSRLVITPQSHAIREAIAKRVIAVGPNEDMPHYEG